ncbi:MAG: prolyl oligopeptidase family serine peptidase [Verrucomicrobiota bacterium]
MRVQNWIWMVAGCLLALRSHGADPAAGRAGAQVEAGYCEIVTRTNQLRYLLYLPTDYKADAGPKWPLVLFLHGAGERGSDLQKVAVHGPPKLVSQGRQFPFILVSPQCPAGQVWDESALVGLVESIQARHRVDPARVYVTGLSMGGYGTWLLAQKHPGRFAAVAPVCGGGDRIRSLLPSQVDALKTLGVWAFHGAKDNVVPLSESERMVEAFKRIGVQDIQLTVYPEANHDSWTATYDNPALYEWLLKHHR